MAPPTLRELVLFSAPRALADEPAEQRRLRALRLAAIAGLAVSVAGAKQPPLRAVGRVIERLCSEGEAEQFEDASGVAHFLLNGARE